MLAYQSGVRHVLTCHGVSPVAGMLHVCGGFPMQQSHPSTTCGCQTQRESLSYALLSWKLCGYIEWQLAGMLHGAGGRCASHPVGHSRGAVAAAGEAGSRAGADVHRDEATGKSGSQPCCVGRLMSGRAFCFAVQYSTVSVGGDPTPRH